MCDYDVDGYTLCSWGGQTEWVGLIFITLMDCLRRIRQQITSAKLYLGIMLTEMNAT